MGSPVQGAVMEQSEGFVAEGQIQIGPTKQYFLFLDGEHLGELLVKHFRLPKSLRQ